MTLRHKARKATLDYGYASEWNDDHEVDFTDELTFSDVFWYHALNAWWSNAQCAGGGSAAIAVVSNHNFAVMTSTAGGGGIGSMRLGTTDMTNKLDLAAATFAINIGTTLSHEFGFFASATVPGTADQAGAYFRIAANVLYAVTGNGAAETTTDLGAPETYNVYRVEFTSTQVKFYVGSMVTPVATHTLTIPAVDLTLKASSMVSGAASQILRCDGVGLTRLRKQ